jgi:outer membrane protein assembly factor BamE (lipoprotein component of BamABCDE complex)
MTTPLYFVTPMFFRKPLSGLCILLAGCSSVPNRNNSLETARANYNAIHRGMSQEEVMGLLGPPDGKDKNGNPRWRHWEPADVNGDSYVELDLNFDSQGSVAKVIVHTGSDAYVNLGPEGNPQYSEISRGNNRGRTPDQLLGLLGASIQMSHAEQTAILKIYEEEEQDLGDLAPEERRNSPASSRIRQSAVMPVRAVLTPTQQKSYDELRNLGAVNPAVLQMRQLDKRVGLTFEQREPARAIFEKQWYALVASPTDEGGSKDVEIRQATRIQIRALLTAEQLRLYEGTPPAPGPDGDQLLSK